jgi:hypothetical protein
VTPLASVVSEEMVFKEALQQEKSEEPSQTEGPLGHREQKLRVIK